MNAENVRFPGFDALSQQRHWDPVTTGVVLERISNLRDFRFFNPDEQAIATVLCDRLLGQGGNGRIPVAAMIDARLAESQTDGWRYADMPEDGQAWRDTLAALREDGFASAGEKEQNALIQAVQDAGDADWHGLPAARVWSLWTRYACTAFYAHPDAWSEMGFPGPAYPRGYKNTGVDRREPFEVVDTRPDEEPR
ncbi:gluconate 2-dehydrogenase subunit 3 family protein [Micromonospora sp. WMMA1363]|uniref:gluconate 2-dehydrogenase subunit 3 family protein n=1 Tax=Micromonospora sp. WMMA1363 TaxID=3053985 RepID=UPI00259D10B8|nr:gluconate 2-dehydrogenase subunit 3 family protein [Micromonospora sp. WMMA1363]MDM4719576.1 gluconate 2-dehydrogenase subunit 3 family protein [Micromonospora sp. WMMA1363]MDM4723448.1 gluconate 2-dehydrogenase subunit 3 family protein [Micromonospora sp. WMMA1363]